MPTHERPDREDPESVYAAWRLQYDEGEGPSLEELCARHPRLVAELNALNKKFERIGDVLAFDPSDPAKRRIESARRSQPFAELLERLRRHQPVETRYEERAEIARGGMGSVIEVYDVDLRRAVAKKVILPTTRGIAGTPQDDPTVLGRFLEEAQVTAQLAHPGVVPVHELGIDDQGRVYFTMDRVAGQTLQDVFALARKEADGWSETRAIGVLVRVCETIAYAHSKGVIHRDLKPSNVMVGAFGEVYVMDWGLAKVLGEPAEDALDPAVASAAPVTTDRRDASDGDVFADLRTETGQAAGTPGYMAPEQARGEVGELDARTDVFAIGALLYSLLTGRKPYADALEKRDAVRALVEMSAGKVVPIRRLAPQATPELVSIAEHAMKAVQEDRYPSAEAMAADLRAWLEGRVVSAHERGAWAELRKWVGRNRGLASAMLVALIAVVGGAGGMALLERSGRLAVDKQRVVAQVNSGPATLDSLLRETEELWPSTPDRVDDLTRWLFLAGQVSDGRSKYEEALRIIRGDPSLLAESGLQEYMRSPLELLLRRLNDLPQKSQWIQSRLAIAQSVEALTISGAEARERWGNAISSISAAYGGFTLAPQLGLLPLRRDPASGLWEFWHVLSGSAPDVDPQTNRWVIREETGVVLVLIPGGSRQVGSPSVSPGDELYDDYRESDHSDPLNHVVTLDPYFISKYELTRAQWRRARAVNSSQSRAWPETHPADMVSWNEGMETLRRFDLTLPTEAQWEVAARGGTKTRFYTGQDYPSLREHVVLLPDSDCDYIADVDATGNVTPLFGRPWSNHHEPVGGCEPNPYGLHDVLGNVYEWCRDVYAEAASPRVGDGLRDPGKKDEDRRVLRGGAYSSPWSNARVTYRYPWSRMNAEPDTGIRAAREVR